MNYLAHAFLADGSDNSILGALLGDFVKGPLDDGRYTAEVTRAIALHRRIDSFTDAHPRVAESRRRITAARRRYAGIMVDMFFDHFLARRWHDFSAEPLERFAARVYAVLESRRETLPPRLLRALPAMVSMDWLTSYRDVGAMHAALARMSRRDPRHAPLLGAASELEQHYAAFDADFAAFFPEVVRFNRTFQTETLTPTSTITRAE